MNFSHSINFFLHNFFDFFSSQMAHGNFTAISLVEKKVLMHYLFLEDTCLYAQTSKRGLVTYVKCIDEMCNCNGKITRERFTRTNDVPHNHPENHAEVASFEIAYENLRNATKTDHRRALRDLHDEAIQRLSLDASGMLSWDRCHRTLERIRNNLMPPCRSMQEMEAILEDESSLGFLDYGRLRNTRFYQGSIDGNLVFANLELIAEIGEDFEMYVDGTFGITPFHARQFLVVLGELNGRPRPIIYAIMHGQCTADYTEIFKFLRDAIFSFDGTERHPSSCTSDFEQAIRLALLEVWPNIRRIGCNFHYCQSLRRHARSIQTLAPNLVPGLIHHKALKMFMRLSLLPLERIDAGLCALQIFLTENDLQDDFREFLIYFRHTWIDRFPKKTWCVSDCDRRTNNHVEGYNHRIKQTIPANPKPWVFLKSLLSLAFSASSDYSADVINNNPAPDDRSDITVPLHAALRELEEGVISEIQFLEKLSYVRRKRQLN